LNSWHAYRLRTLYDKHRESWYEAAGAEQFSVTHAK
jgi:hypothetical protein